jgi:hypothetical protein
MTKPQNGPERKFYAVKLKGHLNESWADWFEDLTFKHEAVGTTTLNGPITDQAAPHGVINGIRDLGLSLISVHPVGRR